MIYGAIIIDLANINVTLFKPPEHLGTTVKNTNNLMIFPEPEARKMSQYFKMSVSLFDVFFVH